MSEEVGDFQSLATLHFDDRGIRLGDLAKAVEQFGVWGWDRYGDFTLFTKGHPENVRALDRLARQNELNWLPPRQDLDPASDLLWFFGWPSSRLPKFEELAVSDFRAVRPSDVTKIGETNLTIVGALLWVLTEKSTSGRDPEFASGSALMDHMEQEFAGIRGLSRRTLEERFPIARKLIEMPK